MGYDVPIWWIGNVHDFPVQHQEHNERILQTGNRETSRRATEGSRGRGEKDYSRSQQTGENNYRKRKKNKIIQKPLDRYR